MLQTSRSSKPMATTRSRYDSGLGNAFLVGQADHTHVKQSVHAATRRSLAKIKGFSDVKVDKVKDAIQKQLVCLTVVSSLADCAKQYHLGRRQWICERC